MSDETGASAGAVAAAEEEARQGAFFDSLRRGGTAIRRDRAQAIAEEAEMAFRRMVEDLRYQHKKLVREREAALDMSPDNALSVINPKDFNAQDLVRAEMERGIALRELEIKLEVVTARYTYLFGGIL